MYPSTLSNVTWSQMVKVTNKSVQIKTNGILLKWKRKRSLVLQHLRQWKWKRIVMMMMEFPRNTGIFHLMSILILSNIQRHLWIETTTTITRHSQIRNAPQRLGLIALKLFQALKALKKHWTLLQTHWKHGLNPRTKNRSWNVEQKKTTGNQMALASREEDSTLKKVNLFILILICQGFFSFNELLTTCEVSD